MSRLLRKDLQALLNTYSAENTSNTPDWILADYLLRCLDAFDLAVLAREQFYGIKSEPSTIGYPSVTEERRVRRLVRKGGAVKDVCMYPMGHRFKHTHDGELPCGCACQLSRGHKGKHQCERQINPISYPSVTNKEET